MGRRMRLGEQTRAPTTAKPTQSTKKERGRAHAHSSQHGRPASGCLQPRRNRMRGMTKASTYLVALWFSRWEGLVAEGGGIPIRWGDRLGFSWLLRAARS